MKAAGRKKELDTGVLMVYDRDNIYIRYREETASL